MPRHSLRTRIRELQLEQLELEGQLQDLSRHQASSFSLRRASEMIREWVWISRHIHRLMWARLERAPRGAAPKKKRVSPQREKAQPV